MPAAGARAAPGRELMGETKAGNRMRRTSVPADRDPPAAAGERIARRRYRLAQWTEKFSNILREKSRLLHGGKVAAPGHRTPAHDIVAALSQGTRRHRNLLGEEGHRHRRLDAVAGRKLERLLARFEVQAC